MYYIYRGVHLICGGTLKIIPAQAEFTSHNIKNCMFFSPGEVRPNISDLCEVARHNNCITYEQSVLIKLGNNPQELYDATALYNFCKNEHLKEMY